MKGINFLVPFFFVACATSRPDYDRTKVITESLRMCYVESDSYSGKEGKVQGSLVVSMMVDPQGKVKTCDIVNSDFKNDPNLHACVRGVYKKSTLPQPHMSREVEVIQTVNFEPDIQ